MKLSKKGEYAIRAMIRLSLNYKKRIVSIGYISIQEKIPKKFLERILIDLKEKGFVKSTRGLSGGYELTRPPAKISMADVIRGIDGPLAPLGCVSRYAHIKCPDEKKCGLKKVMMDVRNAVAGVLERVSFADISK